MNLIIKPIVTEKVTQQTESMNRYAFVVSKSANKIDIINVSLTSSISL